MMKKLMLSLETLEVESFAVNAPRGDSRGTVLAAGAATLPGYCITFTCGDSAIRPCLNA
jgi:hypothetical protein